MAFLVTATFAQVPASNHVVWVMEENESASSVIGSGSAWTYLNSLATQYGLAANYYANYHPSINNYFMITTGTDPAYQATAKFRLHNVLLRGRRQLHRDRQRGQYRPPPANRRQNLEVLCPVASFGRLYRR